MHFLFTQRPGTWHLYCHVAVLTVQYLLLLPLRLCVDVWTSSGAWYLSVWASLMIWRAISIKPSHCLRPEIWSNLVTLSLLSQICFSQYKWWTFLKNMFQGCQVMLSSCCLFKTWDAARVRKWSRETTWANCGSFVLNLKDTTWVCENLCLCYWSSLL